MRSGNKNIVTKNYITQNIKSIIIIILLKNQSYYYEVRDAEYIHLHWLCQYAARNNIYYTLVQLRFKYDARTITKWIKQNNFDSKYVNVPADNISS
jgi:hypothetical protein